MIYFCRVSELVFSLKHNISAVTLVNWQLTVLIKMSLHILLILFTWVFI